jgi:hypothetical protein
MSQLLVVDKDKCLTGAHMSVLWILRLVVPIIARWQAMRS